MAGFDEDRNIYTGLTWGFGSDLYEINEVIWEQLVDGDNDNALRLIRKGRHLFKEVIDQCGPPYNIVFDKNYKKIAPWVDFELVGTQWSPEMTEAATEIFENERNN